MRLKPSESKIHIYKKNAASNKNTTANAAPGSPQSDLESENARLKEQRTCKICMDNEVGVVFLPCGHLCSCVLCAPSLTDCPVCRAYIQDTVRTFLSWKLMKRNFLRNFCASVLFKSDIKCPRHSMINVWWTWNTLFTPSFLGSKASLIQKNHVLDKNWQRNQFPKLNFLWLLFTKMTALDA